jgi:hypothetical protein
LSVLCNWLSLATSQVDRILTALAAPSYEEDDFLCIKACGCAALALECAWEPRLARALVEVFHDETRLIGTRESAQNALLRVDGLSSREIVAAERTNRRALRERAEAVAERLRARASAAT